MSKQTKHTWLVRNPRHNWPTLMW